MLAHTHTSDTTYMHENILKTHSHTQTYRHTHDEGVSQQIVVASPSGTSIEAHSRVMRVDEH
jgi:hypothetical protein